MTSMLESSATMAPNKRPPQSCTRRLRRGLMATAVLASASGCASAAFSSSGYQTRSSSRSSVATTMSGGTGGVTSGSSRLPQQLLLEARNAEPRQRQQRGGAEAPPSSPLRMIVDEQNEFQMAVGKAVDTLKKDYPDMLTDNPDFSIYHDDITVVDPSGVTLHGLRNYKTSFRFMHALVNFFYCPAESGLTFRLVYDWARNNIRVSWNAILIPRTIYGGVRNRLHVDGISVYEFDRASGMVTKHRIEHLMLNDAPVRPVNGVFNAIQEQAVADGIPVLGADGSASAASANPFTVEFREGRGVLADLIHPDATSSTSLFSLSDARGSSGGDDEASFDEKAFDLKNLSRKKFGLAPLTQEQFTELQAQVRKMERDQQRKAATMASAAAELAERKKDKKNALSSLFGNVLEDTCESNFDCERPEICCDFGFKKMCCSSGMKVFNGIPGQHKRQLIRVPAGGGEFPRGGPGGDGPVSGF